MPTTSTPASSTSVPEPEAYYGFVTEDRHELRKGDEIYADGMYDPRQSSSIPKDYVYPPIAVKVGYKRSKKPHTRSKAKHLTSPKKHKFTRLVDQMKAAHEMDSDKYPYKIVKNSHYKVIKVPAPTAEDLALLNRQILDHNVIRTYTTIDKNWIPTRVNPDETEEEMDRRILQNFKHVKDAGT